MRGKSIHIKTGHVRLRTCSAKDNRVTLDRYLLKAEPAPCVAIVVSPPPPPEIGTIAVPLVALDSTFVPDPLAAECAWLLTSIATAQRDLYNLPSNQMAAEVDLEGDAVERAT